MLLGRCYFFKSKQNVLEMQPVFVEIHFKWLQTKGFVILILFLFYFYHFQDITPLNNFWKAGILWLQLFDYFILLWYCFWLFSDDVLIDLAEGLSIILICYFILQHYHCFFKFLIPFAVCKNRELRTRWSSSQIFIHFIHY